jgi:hypothetical protein
MLGAEFTFLFSHSRDFGMPKTENTTRVFVMNCFFFSLSYRSFVLVSILLLNFCVDCFSAMPIVCVAIVDKEVRDLLFCSCFSLCSLCSDVVSGMGVESFALL